MTDVAAERRATQRTVGPVGVAPQGDPLAGAGRYRVDDGGDVFEFPFDRVGGAVAAGPETPSIHGERGQIGAQFGDQRGEMGVVDEGAVDQHQRGPVTLDPDRE